MAVVVRRHADHLVADSGRARRVDAVCPTVADGRDDHDARIDECIGSGRGWRPGPVVEGVADGHVEDVHAVGLDPLHGGDHHVVGHRARAAEHAVGTEADLGCYTERTAGPEALSAPMMPATCVP